MSNTEQDYNVDFCRDMTMSYVDRHGMLKFASEVGDEKRPNSILLFGSPLDDRLKGVPKSPANAARIEQAFQRVISYLKSCGYEVVALE